MVKKTPEKSDKAKFITKARVQDLIITDGAPVEDEMSTSALAKMKLDELSSSTQTP